MSTVLPTPAESSPAPVTTVFVPDSGPERAEFFRTGKMPEDKPKEASEPSKEITEKGETPLESAPGPEPVKGQEHRKSNADSRLNELLDDLRYAGLTPKALKTFQNEYERKQAKAEPQIAAPEKTVNPAIDPKAPVKPKAEDFEGKPWAEYEAAKDDYFEKLSDYKAAKAKEDFKREQQRDAETRELQGKVADAEKRYGAEAKTTIQKASNDIFSDAKIHGLVKQWLNDSSALVDVLYVLGEKEANLSDFLETARSNPRAAITKLVLVEQLVMEELAKGGGDSKGSAERGEDGKFKTSTPEKKTTAAPPPPKELGGIHAAPPNEVETATASAIKGGDARAAIDAMNRDLIRRKKGK